MLIRCYVSEMLVATVDAEKKVRLIKKTWFRFTYQSCQENQNVFEGGVRVKSCVSAIKQVIQACR